MAIQHVKVQKILKGDGQSASAHAHYIAREVPDHASQQALYLERKDRDDLVAAGHANLPGWAEENPARFFAAADRHERKGGIVARTWEMALPRELSPTQRLELAEDIRAVLFQVYPHAWAVHNKLARDGGEQPHLHVMVHERKPDGIDREPEQFFKRVAVAGKDPASGGARKDLSWNPDRRVMEVREVVATLTNAALERAGHDVAVDAHSLKDRGMVRTPERELMQEERWAVAQGKEVPHWNEVLAGRETLHRDYHPFENELNRAAWEQQKQREHIDIDRQAVLRHVRDRFWLHDRSPAREQERAESVEQFIAREYAKAGRSLLGPMRLKPERAEDLGLDSLLRDEGRGGVRVRFRDREQGWER